MIESIAEIHDLTVRFQLPGEEVHAVDHVTLTVGRGEILGIVGESGSGKSTLAMAIGGEFAGPSASVEGRVLVNGIDVRSARPKALQQLRSRDLGFIFQNPITSLDPTRRVRDQFFDPETGPIPAFRTAELLRAVELRDVERVMACYPHQLSGGMAQRVTIAMCLAHSPKLVVADEPTSALDASVRLQILDLLTSICRESGAALLIVSHDLRAVHRYCERVIVMLQGRIVEEGPTQSVFADPSHPYTRRLVASIPGHRGFDALPAKSQEPADA